MKWLAKVRERSQRLERSIVECGINWVAQKREKNLLSLIEWFWSDLFPHPPALVYGAADAASQIRSVGDPLWVHGDVQRADGTRLGRTGSGADVGNTNPGERKKSK